MIFNLQRKIFCSLFIILFSCQTFATPFTDYLDELNGKSGYNMSGTTKKRLRAYHQNNVQSIHGAALDAKHDSFNANKNALITKWEQYTGKNWPKYTYVTNNRNVGDRYDAHHIIPQSYNGPNKWWNLFPLTNVKHHQVHTNGSKCSTLFPNSRGHGRTNEAYLP